MKFQPDLANGAHQITRMGASGLWVDGQAYQGALVVPWAGEITAWAPQRFEDLQSDDFAQLLRFAPEVVIFGSGQKLRFAPPALLTALHHARVGVETMDTAAACRTFNVLASEGRSVVAALLSLP